MWVLSKYYAYSSSTLLLVFTEQPTIQQLEDATNNNIRYPEKLLIGNASEFKNSDNQYYTLHKLNVFDQAIIDMKNTMLNDLKLRSDDESAIINIDEKWEHFNIKFTPSKSIQSIQKVQPIAKFMKD